MEHFRGQYKTGTVRINAYDYSQAGLYFITIVTQSRKMIFGNIDNGILSLNNLGIIVQKCWDAIPQHFPNISLFEYVIMPNHFHGIIAISFVETRHAVSLRNNPQTERFGHPTRQSIPTIIRSFKAAVTKSINESRNNAGKSVWQRGYYEHVVRTENELNRIREYILTNPQNWLRDAYAE